MKNPATSSADITIAVAGGLTPTYMEAVGYTGTISITSSITLSMVVKDEDGAFVTGAFAYIDDGNTAPFIMNTTTNASGLASVNHTGGSVIGSTWRVRKYGYKPFKLVTDIGGSDINIPVTLVADPQQT